MKLRQLEIILEDVKGFENPKIKLEQYETPPHLAGLCNLVPYCFNLCFKIFLKLFTDWLVSFSTLQNKLGRQSLSFTVMTRIQFFAYL